MTNSSISRQSPMLPPAWCMPIVPETYPDREPRLTDEEKTLMEQYVSAAGRTMTGVRARRIIDRLTRFEQPYVDTVRLISPRVAQRAAPFSELVEDHVWWGIPLMTSEPRVLRL